MPFRILDDPAGVIETDTVEEMLLVVESMGRGTVRCCSGPTGDDEIGCLFEIHGAWAWPPSVRGRYPSPLALRRTCVSGIPV